MNKIIKSAAALLLIGSTLGIAAGPASAQPHDNWNNGRHDDRGRDDRRPDKVVVVKNRPPNRVVYNYDYNRPDPRYRGGYYADRYYRTGGNYSPVRVTRQTRIYRGNDNRYYCRRSDGTTGLIIGAALGGVIGNQVDRGSSSLLGTVLGAGAGGLLGQSIDRGKVTCR